MKKKLFICRDCKQIYNKFYHFCVCGGNIRRLKARELKGGEDVPRND